HFQVPIESSYESDATLRITDTSCTCTNAEFDVPSLAPGGIALLTADVLLDGLRGPFRQQVSFVSQCGAKQDEWCVTLAGTSIGDVDFSVREIALGNLSESPKKHVEIIVRDPGDGSLSVVGGEVTFDDRDPEHRLRAS